MGSEINRRDRSERDRNRERDRDRDRDREKDRDRDRDRDRDKDRDRSNRDRDRDRDRDRERDRDERRRYPSKSSRSRKQSKKSKKYSRRSSSFSSSSSSERSNSDDSRNSTLSSSHTRNTARAPSCDSNSRITTTLTTPAVVVKAKDIDLLDTQVQNALETIEEESFVPRAFFSTRDREAPEKKPAVTDKVIIDLETQTVTLPKPIEPLKEQIFHPNFLGDPELKAEKWVRKLYNFRQKYYQE